MRIERKQTAAALKIVRTSFQSGFQAPLDWPYFYSLPLVVGDFHVAVRAMTPEDWEQLASEEETRANDDHAIRMVTPEACRSAASKMRQRGQVRGFPGGP